MPRTVLIVPGLRGSGPAHWQSLWQVRHAHCRRVLQREWAVPRPDEWAAAIDRAIREAQGQVFLVAHGFGCLATLRRLTQRHSDVTGALLVAPRDPAEFGLAALLPRDPLHFPVTLVASQNDPWMPFTSAQRLAAQLGSCFVDAGRAGHIDASSGYGPWPKGERLLRELFARGDAGERELRVALALVA